MDKEANLDIARKFKNFLRKNFSFDRLILFGSRSRENFNEDSDFDFVIVSGEFENAKKFGRYGMVRKYWDVDYSVDFICLTPEEFERRKGNVQSVVGLAIEEGVEV